MGKKVLFGGVPGMLESDIKKMERYVLEEHPSCEFHFYGEQTLSKQELIDIGKDADILISWDQEMDDETYKALNLTAYCAASIGFNAANIDAATRNRVYVSNVPDYCTEEVSTHAITLMLSLYRRFYLMIDYIKDGNWDLSPMKNVRRFENSTVGLMGFGKISRNVASKLRGFGVNIIAYDPYVDENVMKNNGVRKVDFDELLQESDYLSLHTPLMENTKNIINEVSISKMKEGAFIINTSRGGLIDEKALFSALKSGKIGAAALDVLGEEPPSDSGRLLIQSKNTIITGHSSYVSLEASDDQIRMTAMNVGKFLSGNIPNSCINVRDINREVING